MVAILTGHQLKDPEYTINYHQDNLYEHATYDSVLVEKSGKLHASFANQPVRVKADKVSIRELLGI